MIRELLIHLFRRDIHEAKMLLTGYRKPSLLGEVSEQEVQPIYSDVPKKKKSMSMEIDLSGSHEISQGNTGSCACATPCGMTQDHSVKVTKEKNREVDWRTPWEKMKTMGMADDKKGSYLEDNLWFLQNIGYRDSFGTLWKADNIQKIGKSEIEDYIRMGYQIYTGAVVKAPMCTVDHVFRGRGSAYGHAFRLIGITHKNDKKQILAETTWLNYGYKKESQFFINPDDLYSLMSCYAVSFKRG